MRSRQRRDGSATVIPALVLACVWALGFEAAPLAHAIEHHAGTSAVHCHDGTCHADGDGSGIAAADHGDHTLSHRDVAATPTPSAIVHWPAIVVADALHEIRITGPIDEPAPALATARGPPSA